MKMIIEYEDKYIEHVRDLLVELEKYNESNNEENLDIERDANKEKME